ncbi:hypothetical protein WICPIJ_001098 [Wickerhamomyces pijperi]|uniref:Peroxisome assembly protein 22 n=1 Tax=Wickerhamomyces pijperi TaxID=599730 RepID=A0A9P8QEG1_WICPI|nr:hypothetical protein WICPIJ_001098 [Wickerhamomyces pijperi]
MMNRQRRKTLALYAACGVCLAGVAYSIYSYYTTGSNLQNESQDGNNSNDNKKPQYTSRSISILITDSIISSDLSIVNILKHTENVTLILTEGLTSEDLSNIIDEVDMVDFNRLKYKIIKADKNESVPPLLNHLNNDLVIYTKSEFNLDSKYLRAEIVGLGQELESVNDTVLSYIVRS